jgi:hypothetical protein
MRKIPILRVSTILALVFNFNLAFGAAAASPSQPSRPLITSAINETSRVTLTGNTRPEANAKNDRGRVSDDIAGSPRNNSGATAWRNQIWIRSQAGFRATASK